MSAWILLRGLMRESRHWGDFPAIFRRVVGAENIAMPDFPGNGRLHHLQSPASIEEMVECLRADMQQRNMPPPYNVLALSLGAMVAVAWASRYPAELSRLVLINTSLAGYSPFYQRLRPANYPGTLLSLVFGSTKQRERRVLKMTSRIASHSARRDAIVEQWSAYAAECPVTHVNALRQLIAAMRYRAPAVPPTVPKLILCAQHDRLVDVKCSIMLAEKWHCEIRMHPQAGHDLPLDDGAWVAEQVKNWPG